MSITGSHFPDFCIPAVINMNIEKIKLSDFKKKYIVFLFYPNDFSKVCPYEVMAFNKRYEDFKNRNTEVIAISGDSVYCHMKWQQLPHADGGIGKLDIIHGADFTHDLIKTLGIYYMNDEEEADNTNGGCYRAMYIVDPDGKIVQSLVNDNNLERSVEECLRNLDVLQEVKKTGNTCKANTKFGDATTKAVSDN